MIRHAYFPALLVLISGSESASAAPALDGASMTWAWSVPFVGVLLSIATGPLLFPKLWHDHYGTIAFAWAALTLAGVGSVFGFSAAISVFVQSMFREYLSFILLLFALYTVAGGVVVTGRIQAGPLVNTVILALGTSLASVIGTTGAAMILVRPIIRANEFRRHQAHVIIFFIILVANIGGALTPLGDPPLFIGYLHGVDFFWTTQHLWMQTLIVAVLLLAIFLLFDAWAFRKELVTQRGKVNFRIRGKINFVLIAIILAAMLTSAAWKPGIAFELYGSTFELQNLLRDAVFVVLRWRHFV